MTKVLTLCLGLLPLNAFILVNSQPIVLSNFCPKGFFGPDCKFKCHCRNKGDRVGCEMNGHCFKKEFCASPYFGYLCQYVNIAPDVMEGKQFYNDRDVKTCSNMNAQGEIRLSFKSVHIFHFISLRFKNLTREQEESVLDIHLNFRDNGKTRECKGIEFWNVSRTSADIYCSDPQYEPIQGLVLLGRAITVICEVYFSAGRDVAHISQSSFINQKHLDYTNYTVNDTNCFLARGSFVWRQTFAVTPQVFQLSFHSFKDYPLEDFELTINDKERIYPYNNSQEKYVVDFNSSVVIFYIDLQVNAKNRHTPRYQYTSICGFEVYGDCPSGRAGIDCQNPCTACKDDSLKCDVRGHCLNAMAHFDKIIVYKTECSNCAKGSTCDNGVCSLGCKSGFKGARCTEECGSCGGSKECNQQSGSCLSECAPGYSGELCTQPCGMCSDRLCYQDNQTCLTGECLAGYRGHNCFTRCERCGGTGRCDMNTGACLDKCKIGFRGDVCLLQCTNCAGNGACEQMSGNCSHGCNFGYKGPTCSERCTNCGGNGSCDPETGDCTFGCRQGFKGSTCSQPCTFCQEKECDAKSGRCIRGCELGHYNQTCESVCQNCARDGSCYRLNGSCVYGCKDGFWKEQCYEACDNCKTSCEIKTGFCKGECKEGYTGTECKDTDMQNDNKASTSALISYAYFIVIMSIILFIVFFGQTIFDACYIPARESLDSLRSRKTKSSSDSTVATNRTRSTGTQEGLGEYGELVPKDAPKFIKLTDWIIDTRKSQRLDFRRSTMTSVDDGKSSYSSSPDKLSQKSNSDDGDTQDFKQPRKPKQTQSAVL